MSELNEHRLLRLLATPEGERRLLVDQWDREDAAFQRLVMEKDHEAYERGLYEAEIEVRVWQKKPWWLRQFTKPDTFGLELAGRYPAKDSV